jgi:hypothetical protein
MSSDPKQHDRFSLAHGQPLSGPSSSIASAGSRWSGRTKCPPCCAVTGPSPSARSRPPSCWQRKPGSIEADLAFRTGAALTVTEAGLPARSPASTTEPTLATPGRPCSASLEAPADRLPPVAFAERCADRSAPTRLAEQPEAQVVTAPVTTNPNPPARSHRGRRRRQTCLILC